MVAVGTGQSTDLPHTRVTRSGSSPPRGRRNSVCGLAQTGPAAYPQQLRLEARAIVPPEYTRFADGAAKVGTDCCVGCDR